MRRAARQTAQPTRHGLARSLCAVAQLAKTVPLPNISPVSLAARQIGQGPSRMIRFTVREFGLTNAPLRCRSRQGENEATSWYRPRFGPDCAVPSIHRTLQTVTRGLSHSCPGASPRPAFARPAFAPHCAAVLALDPLLPVRPPGTRVFLALAIQSSKSPTGLPPVQYWYFFDFGGLTTPAMWPEPAITIVDVAAEILQPRKTERAGAMWSSLAARL